MHVSVFQAPLSKTVWFSVLSLTMLTKVVVVTTPPLDSKGNVFTCFILLCSLRYDNAIACFCIPALGSFGRHDPCLIWVHSNLLELGGGWLTTVSVIQASEAASPPRKALLPRRAVVTRRPRAALRVRVTAVPGTRPPTPAALLSPSEGSEDPAPVRPRPPPRRPARLE